MEEGIKEAFSKVKQDMELIKHSLSLVTESVIEHRQRLNEFSEVLNLMNHYLTNLANSYSKLKEDSEKRAILQNFNVNIEEPSIPTNQHINPTNQHINPTDNRVIKPLKAENIVFSTGNEGVPTDKQTNQQTNQQTQNNTKNLQNTPNSISNALDLLNSLDSVKKEIRLQFKRLTDQEMAVFSAMYQLDEEKGYSDYKLLSDKLNLSESSIREYVGKLMKKGISVEKFKINNKTIQLRISPNLKRITNLPAILQLRDM